MTQRLPSTKEEARSGWRNYCKDPSSITQIMKGDLGFGPNTVVSDNGNTALQVTIIYSSHEATKILFNYGADPNKMNNSGRSAVCLAISTNRSTPTADNYNKVVTMLRKATEETLKAVVQTYLSTSINDPIIDCQITKNGNLVIYKNTLIYLCVRACNIKGVRTLLQWGANPATPQLSSGSNCLHCACYYGYWGLISLLCSLPCAGEMAAHVNACGDIPLTDLLMSSVPSCSLDRPKELSDLLSLHIPTLIAGDVRSYKRVEKIYKKSSLILNSIKDNHELTQRVLMLFNEFEGTTKPVTSKVENKPTEPKSEGEIIEGKTEKVLTEDVVVPIVPTTNEGENESTEAKLVTEPTEHFELEPVTQKVDESMESNQETELTETKTEEPIESEPNTQKADDETEVKLEAELTEAKAEDEPNEVEPVTQKDDDKSIEPKTEDESTKDGSVTEEIVEEPIKEDEPTEEVVDEEVSTVIKPDEWTPELSTEVDTEDNTAPRRRATEDTVNLLFALSSPIETGTVTQQHVDPSSITEQNETTSLPQTFETPEEEVGTEPVADKVESVAEKVPEPTPVNVEVEPVTEEIVQPVTQKEDLTHASEPVPVPEKTDPVTDAAEPEVGEPETEEVIEPATQKADPISDAAEPVSEPVAEEIVQPVTQKKDSVTNAAEPVPVPEETDPVTDEPETETQKADLVTEAAIPDPEEVVEAATKAVTEENIEPVTEVAVPADGKVSEPVSKEVIEPVNEEKVVEPATQKVEDDKPQTPVKSINTDGDETTEEGWIPIDSEQVPVEEQPAPVAKKGLMGNLFGYVLPKKK
eukprot:TRINITY_DN2364_c0_g2_i7.p1 TRINITY_DN2364_c0_g2~~TRINITY_DN2364_c0_g2_i7.p1  ORF type:complete len:819 (+),score=195.79 TRINITY_DN2364_c0_g2_i7:23-2458(+)